MTNELDRNRIPRHVAIIMDGNGRWAKARGQERSAGHQQGAQQMQEIVEEASRLGIEYITLYTFSTENWNRPAEEISTLMSILMDNIKEELFMKNNVRFKVIGDRKRLRQDVQEALSNLEQVTSGNTGTCMVSALSYSSKWEIMKAIKEIAALSADGKLDPDTIDEHVFEQHLETHDMPDPELLIRTGGELRLSNYLLWQCAYSELYFTNIYWPDFSIDEFHKAIIDYQGRQRRYGKTGDQVENENKSK
ncbi:MAG: isoprenyl transferase [Bacteroidaceae bacterium]|nr:isoprenyl transferase [Bacteroidaceae bacterium]